MRAWPHRPGPSGVHDLLAAGRADDVDTIADSFAVDATWWLHGDLPLAGTRAWRAIEVSLSSPTGRWLW